jgi:hypothetical protein
MQIWTYLIINYVVEPLYVVTVVQEEESVGN